MLAYLPWPVGSKRESPPILGGSNLGPGVAGLGVDLGACGGPKVHELGVDLHFETMG